MNDSAGLTNVLAAAMAERDREPVGSETYMDAVETIIRMQRLHPELLRERIAVMDAAAHRHAASWDDLDV
jgi:hypothetical protein